MGMFADYVEKRKIQQLAELCGWHGINLEPLVQLSERILSRSDLAPEEMYNEFLQQAANTVGNLAGRAVGGINNMVNSFGQGYQQGRGQQVGAGQNQQQAATGQNQQSSQNVQMALKQLQGLKGFVQQIGGDNQKIAQDVKNSIEFIDRISQMIQQITSGTH